MIAIDLPARPSPGPSRFQTHLTFHSSIADPDGPPDLIIFPDGPIDVLEAVLERPAPLPWVCDQSVPETGKPAAQ